jgi:hypothetical protein
VGRETRWPASKEEILEEMVAKSSGIDFLKSNKTSLKELTNSEFCETEEEGSQGATFLSEDEYEEGESSMARVADKVPLAGQTKSVTSTDVGSPRESEAEDSSVSSKDQSWISKSFLLKLPGKELAPNPEKEEP